MKEKILQMKGLWLVTKEDKTKWVIDLDNMLFDSYDWYKKVGTLESIIEDVDWFMKNSSMRRIEKWINMIIGIKVWL